MVTSRNHDSMARVYAIASAKGGVGKTTTTANLGATLAETGADVVVIDGDIGMANLGAALGVEPTGPTLHDVLAGETEPQQAAYEGPAGLRVVPGDTSLDSFAAADPQRLEAVLEAFDDADFMLIDVGAGVSHETSIPLSVSDAVVLVSTAERDALVDTEKTRQLTERLGGVVAGAVITRTDEATPLEEVVSGTLTANVLTTIPDDEAVRESIAVGEPLVSYAPHSAAAAGYRELARQLTGRTPARPEPTATQQAAETREALEASGEQLSDSLSDASEQPDDQAAETAHSSDQTAPPETEPPATEASDADHNVVNPFAAKPKERPTDAVPADQTDAKATQTNEQTDQTADSTAQPDRPEPEAESKWFDAATSTNITESSDDTSDLSEPTTTQHEESTPPTHHDEPATTTHGDDKPDESVPQDAIPFGGDSDDSQETSETTVLGTALEDENDETAHSDSTAADTNAEDTADEPLIPDAEGESTDAEEPPEAAISVDEPEESDDDDDKRGFFSRLFR